MNKPVGSDKQKYIIFILTNIDLKHIIYNIENYRCEDKIYD